MNSLIKMRHAVNKFLSKHLFATNVASFGTLLGLGDFTVQRIGMDFKEEKNYDFARTGRMIVIGFTLGPFNHFWYAFLDRAVKGRSLQAVLKKILCDQMVAGPFFCSSFLVGMSLLEGRGMKEAKEELLQKFLPIYKVDWAFWPMAQLINFRFIPGQFRVLYVSMATLIWNSFLSYMKHGEVEADDEDVH